MTRNEFIHRAALTLGFESDSIRHLKEYADRVHAIAPFDEELQEDLQDEHEAVLVRIVAALEELAECVAHDGERRGFRTFSE